MEGQKFKSFTIRLTPDDHKKVKVLAAEMGLTIKDLLLQSVARLREEHDKQSREIKPIGESVRDIWEDEDEIYVRDNDGQDGQLNYGWWKGCSVCEKLKDEIKDIQQENGTIEACRYALNHLYDDREDGFLCRDCALNKRMNENE